MVTNHSSETSTYFIFVVFEQAGVRVADSRAVVPDLQAGQTAQWETPTFQRVDGDFRCRVQEVERLAT